jgi:hypothetical protein
MKIEFRYHPIAQRGLLPNICRAKFWNHTRFDPAWQIGWQWFSIWIMPSYQVSAKEI